MPDSRETKSLAVLIDADNTSAKHAQAIFDEIIKLGEANVRRIYGDFTGSQLSGWDKAVGRLAILQHQQRSNSKGKNASDIALVIDAMDLMYKRTLDGIVLVSSDSDFTRLAQRLREEGLEVYGFGERKAVEAFRNACNRFIYVENLVDTGPEATVGNRIQGALPDFDPRSYGCPNLSTLVEKSGGFDIRKERGAVHVRLKAAARKGSGAGKGSAA